jgi:hypothetical protein
MRPGFFVIPGLRQAAHPEMTIGGYGFLRARE